MNTSSHSFFLRNLIKADFCSHYAIYEQLPNTTTIEKLFILPQCRITLYKSQKVLFQGAQATKEFQKWSPAELDLPEQDQTVVDDFLSHIGCDETGVGDYLAPLVSAACFITPKTKALLSQLGIQDSKQLLDKNILLLAPKIKATIPYAISIITNQQYNAFVDNGFNAHAIKAFIHNKTLERLFLTYPNIEQNIPIIMDQFASAKNYRNYLTSRKIKPLYLPTHFETKAENKFFAVACASIIARAYFLERMEEQNLAYNTIFPLGAGSKVDAFAKHFITIHSSQALKSLAKWHFANTHKI
ncbi:MAG: ribonuclease HIII [Culicoidibacterales bacterium]